MNKNQIKINRSQHLQLWENCCFSKKKLLKLNLVQTVPSTTTILIFSSFTAHLRLGQSRLCEHKVAQSSQFFSIPFAAVDVVKVHLVCTSFPTALITLKSTFKSVIQQVSSIIFIQRDLVIFHVRLFGGTFLDFGTNTIIFYSSIGYWISTKKYDESLYKTYQHKLRETMKYFAGEDQNLSHFVLITKFFESCLFVSTYFLFIYFKFLFFEINPGLFYMYMRNG